LNDLVKALDLCFLLPDDFALLAEGDLSNGLILCFDLGLEVIDLVVQFEDKPAKVIALLPIQFL
jgi:hypothetical protein